MIIQKEIILPVFKRGYHLITDLILSEMPEMKGNGIFNIFIKHTSAGLTINENADYTVREDFETVFNRLIPENQTRYKHTFEGADDLPAHIKASIIGNSLTIPVSDSHLNLGTWQGVYLCEFRNRGGQRKLVLTFYS